jgi:hypothetical protein
MAGLVARTVIKGALFKPNQIESDKIEKIDRILS